MKLPNLHRLSNIGFIDSMFESEVRDLVLEEPESTHEELRGEILRLLASDFDVLNDMVRRYDITDYETEEEAREYIRRTFWVDRPTDDGS